MTYQQLRLLSLYTFYLYIKSCHIFISYLAFKYSLKLLSYRKLYETGFEYYEKKKLYNVLLQICSYKKCQIECDCNNFTLKSPKCI